MISLDQILLLEQKVEGAVAKIAQLQAENDALRKSCAELTNALSAKSEQLSSFEQDQSRIENGIIKALDRLNSIENAILSSAGQESSAQTNAPAPTEQTVSQEQPLQSAAVIPEQQPVLQQTDAQPEISTDADNFQQTNDENQSHFSETEQFQQNDSINTNSFDEDFSESDEETPESDNSDNGLFDIF